MKRFLKFLCLATVVITLAFGIYEFSNKYNLNLEENQLLKYFSNLMPLRRINEFLLLKMILLNENVKFEDFYRITKIG